MNPVKVTLNTGLSFALRTAQLLSLVLSVKPVQTPTLQSAASGSSFHYNPSMSEPAKGTWLIVIWYILQKCNEYLWDVFKYVMLVVLNVCIG